MNEKITHNRKKAQLLKKAWDVDANHVRYRENGTWYHPLERFPAALFDSTGYIRFPTEEALPAEHICPGGDYTFPNGISSLPGYVRKVAAGASPTFQTDEVHAPESFWEGALRRISVNAFERDAAARRACIAYFGASCRVCASTSARCMASLAPALSTFTTPASSETFALATPLTRSKT